MLSCTSVVNAQKHDYQWLFGYGTSFTGNPLWNSTLINFGDNLLTPTRVQQPLTFLGSSANAGICDKEGNLLFYTNGCFIANAAGDTIEGGGLLNWVGNSGLESWCADGDGYVISNSVVAVPIEPDSGIYALIHKDVANGPAPNYSYGRHLYITRLDMKANGGAGKVYQSKVIHTDTLGESDITACKHSNGKDWWFTVLGVRDNVYRTFLVQRDTVLGPYYQTIGDSLVYGYDICQATFSPDGKQYARVNWCNGVMLYDFDRSTGLLSNYRNFNYGCAGINDSLKLCGIAFSPNSRYLYVSGWLKMYQLDTQQPDLQGSAVFIAEFDGYRDSVGSTYRWQQFFVMANGPDCKIYITPPTQGRVLHVIHHPDEPAPFCDFEQHAIMLPTYRARNIPVFAHYRLDTGPVCDSSLSVVKAIWHLPESSVLDHMIYPNPTEGTAHLDIDVSRYRHTALHISDAQGRLVYRQALKATVMSYPIDLEHLAAGVYFYTITEQGRVLTRGKLVRI